MRQLGAVALFVAFGAGVPASGGAYFYSGNDLKEYFDSKDDFRNGVAAGFVLGVADTYQGSVTCMPGGESGVRSGQVIDVIKRYLDQNPEVRTQAAHIIVATALQNVWPCQKKIAAPKRQSKSRPKTAEPQSPF